MDNDERRRYAEIQQRWHGWGSPVGLSILIVGFGMCVALCGWTVFLFV